MNFFEARIIHKEIDVLADWQLRKVFEPAQYRMPNATGFHPTQKSFHPKRVRNVAPCTLVRTRATNSENNE
jgi:hypothetical protein